jgi:hypothetical protein
MNNIQEWKNWLLTLPETTFFGLARNYLGNLETPFSKHKLFDDLSAFLCRPPVQEALAASLDDLDHLILGIIDLLDTAPEAPILDVLTPRWSAWELRQRLTNLQERLLLFKDSRDIYRFTPLLEQMLREKTLDNSLLIPVEERSEGSEEPPWLDSALLAAFRSYLRHTPPVLKSDGLWSKRSENDFAVFFPRFAEMPERGKLFLTATAGEGLYEIRDSRWILAEHRWEALSNIPARERLFRLWARGLTVSIPSGHQWPLSEAIRLIKVLSASLDPRKLYPRESLIRIAQLGLTELRPRRQDIIHALGALTTLGLLVEETSELYGLPREKGLTEPPAGSGVILHPNFELTIPVDLDTPGGLDFSLALKLTDSFELVRHDRIGQYHLSQESYSRGRGVSGSGTTLQEILAQAGAGTLPQNIAFSLDHWDRQLSSVRLLEGLILKISEEKIPLFEKNPLLSPHILETLAPGIYFLDPADRALWEPALLRMGITALPSVEKPSSGDSAMAAPNISPSPPVSALSLHRNPPPPLRSEGPEPLLALVDGMPLNHDEKEELSDRIRKRVILFPEQLRADTVPREIREARGVDYQGKIRLIQEALSTGQEYLEVSWFTPEDEVVSRNLIPRHLLKEEEELILTGPLIEEPGGKDFQIRVRKISRVRRRKLNFFFR